MSEDECARKAWEAAVSDRVAFLGRSLKDAEREAEAAQRRLERVRESYAIATEKLLELRRGERSRVIF